MGQGKLHSVLSFSFLWVGYTGIWRLEQHPMDVLELLLLCTVQLFLNIWLLK